VFLGRAASVGDCRLAVMSASQMRVEDRLAGASNWSSWKARMVFVLEDLELWDIVEAVVPAIPVTAPVLVAEYRKRNNKAKRTISDGVRDHIIPHVTGKAHAYQMWAALISLYESSNENRKMVLHDRLRSIRMLKDESVSSFLARFTQIRDELGAVGEVIVPNSLVRQALQSFTKPWGPFIQGIVAREALPTWERMWDDFAQEEIRLASESSGQRQQQSGQGGEDLALWAKGKKKAGRGGRQGPKTGGQPQRSGGGAESGSGQSSGHGSGQGRDMSKVKCFVCKKFGHYAGQCPNRKKKKGGTAATAEETDFQTQFQQECAFPVCCSSVEYSPHIWYIDSGASSHITSVREHFSDLRDTEVRIDISLGDNRVVTVAGIGTVSFRRENLPPISFTDVLFVPGMKKNLISVSTLQDRGFEVSFRGTEVLIYPRGCSIDSGQVIGVREGDLYRLLFQPLHALVASSDSSGQLCELWHRRMAHLHHGALGGLREVVTGVPQISIEHQDVCRGCALGKFAKASFPSSDSRSAGILDLVHTDVCGPMSRKSLSGCEYYLTFIDDYSRKTWIYFLKAKSEVFARFQEFRALVENQSGKRIKVLRSDNGGEYSSRQFVDFCAQHGIRRQMTVPYNPQQNGVAERKNRAITGAARSMLHDQSLPLYLWAEACGTAVYLQNRSPHRILGKMTPEEAFTGRRPDVEHIRIFGCSTFSHVPSERRTKLDPTAQQGILVGYSEVSKAYRIYIPPLRKVVVSRDVRFEEDRAFARSLESSRAVEDDAELPVAASEGAQPQWSGTPFSEVTGSPCTASESQAQHVQSDGAQTSERGQTSGSQSVEASPEAITLGQRDLTSPLTTSGKRRPRWFQETLKEAIENVGEPKSQIRQRRPPVRLGAYLALVTTIRDIEPQTFAQAVDHQVWREAMVEEYDSIVRNDVWDVVPRPVGKSVVTSRWLYKTKIAADGSVEKHKARFVARGFSQIEGVDYDETFAPVARYTSIRTIIAIAAEMGWRIHQMDVKTAFLNGFIEEEVYIEQPQGFEVSDRETHVCLLRKALYGLKQAPRAWYSRIDTYLLQMGFEKSDADPNLYFIIRGEDTLILILYVDDLFITGAEDLIADCKLGLASEFEMSDIGLMHYFLGMEVWQEEGHIFLGQGKYAADILSRFQMEDCRPMSTPMITNWKKLSASDSQLVDATVYRQLIGSLMYLVNTRPDICFAVNTLSQYMVEPRSVHMVGAKHVLRYVAGTVDFGLDYVRGDGVSLVGYTDSDWAGCAADRKSTSGCCFSLGSGLVSWFSRKQKSVALSSAEAEYMAASQASCEAIWLRKMLVGLFGQEMAPTVIHCDNQSCIKLSENPVFHDRSKHIEIRYHFIRDWVQRGAVQLQYISTDDQVADILTKALPRGKHVFFRDKMGLVRNTFLGKREC
jgi:hypothetical protein